MGLISSALHPVRTAFKLVILFVLLVGGITIGFAYLFNHIQDSRRDYARDELIKQGKTVVEQELNQRYPDIEIF